MKYLAVKLVFIILLMSSCSFNSNRPINYSKNFSQGFYDEGYVYFLLDYKVWKKGKVYWFIMPIEGKPRVYYREISLYRYEPEMNKLEKLDLVENDNASKAQVSYTRFTKENNNIIFSYSAGYDLDIKPLVALYMYNKDSNTFVSTGHEYIINKDSELFEKYFGNYLSPWTDNPGVIGISRLKNVILKDVPEEEYYLPEVF